MDIAVSRRTAEAPGNALGERLRELRRRRNWTVQKAADRCGIAKSSLSKIENGRMSPTYELLLKIVGALDIDLGALFSDHVATQPITKCVTRREDEHSMRTGLVDYRMHAPAIEHKRLMPMRCLIAPPSGGTAPAWNRHSGEEFLYVVRGMVGFLYEDGEPELLREGDSIYIDSTRRHAVYSALDEDSEALWISAY